MNLETFCGKRVNLIDEKGQNYQGMVIAFSYAKDDEANEDSIDLDCGHGFYESDIKSIEILEG